jgi:hypothetical protein
VATALPFVEAVARDGEALTVTLGDGADTPALVRSLVEAGARIHEVVPVRATLEDVYLELILDSAPAARRAP